MIIMKAIDYTQDDLISLLCEEETIVLEVSKDELLTIKQALYETAISKDIIKAQPFGLLNRDIDNYLSQGE